MRNALLVAGALLPIVSSWTYIVGIWRGKVRPQRMTHLLLCVITGLSLVALISGDDRSGVWLALTSFIQCTIIGVLSIAFGMGGRDRLDIACLVLCMGGVVLWLVSGESLFGLGMSIAADLVACIPSLVKTYRYPHTESLMFYALDTLAGVCIALAGPYTWQAVVFPAYIALINGAFVWLIARPIWFRQYKSGVPTRDTA